MPVDAGRLAFTTDSFVVRPLTFPGGSIGELAVNGTVNDLAVSGARPLALSLSLVLEEGLDVDIDPGSGGGTTVTRVASGAYDIGFADMGSIIEYSANLANPAARVQATYLGGATHDDD